MLDGDRGSCHVVALLCVVLLSQGHLVVRTAAQLSGLILAHKEEKERKKGESKEVQFLRKDFWKLPYELWLTGHNVLSLLPLTAGRLGKTVFRFFCPILAENLGILLLWKGR